MGCSFSSVRSRTTEKLSSQLSPALQKVDLPGSDAEVELGARGQQAMPQLVEIRCDRKQTNRKNMVTCAIWIFTIKVISHSMIKYVLCNV